jgi:hypothetical protein
MYSREDYIPCGGPAVAIVYHDKEHRGYYMCLGCADHNCHNRGGKLVTSTNRALAERYPLFVPPKPPYTLGPLAYRRSTGENHQWLVHQEGDDRATTAIVFREGDARLYAKAPALLRVLKDLVEAHDAPVHAHREVKWEAAREAIKEAE